jgi:pyruvate dehydrogenase E1 component alpha subunit
MQPPPKTSMFEHVYASRNAVVDRERAWFTDYEAAFEDTGATAGAAR